MRGYLHSRADQAACLSNNATAAQQKIKSNAKIQSNDLFDEQSEDEAISEKSVYLAKEGKNEWGLLMKQEMKENEREV